MSCWFLFWGIKIMATSANVFIYIICIKRRFLCGKFVFFEIFVKLKTARAILSYCCHLLHVFLVVSCGFVDEFFYWLKWWLMVSNATSSINSLPCSARMSEFI